MHTRRGRRGLWGRLGLIGTAVGIAAALTAAPLTAAATDLPTPTDTSAPATPSPDAVSTAHPTPPSEDADTGFASSTAVRSDAGTPVAPASGTDTGQPAGAAAHLAAPAAVPLPYDNVGIGEMGAGDGDFDGGVNYFARSELAAQGLVQGTTVAVPGTDLVFTFPVTTSGQADNVRANGQRIDLPTEWSAATEISLVGASAFGAQAGNADLLFADGSTRSVRVVLADWCSSTNPGGGNIPIAIPDHRATGTGQGGGGCGIYSTSPITLGAGESLIAVTLPPGLQNMHVFAVASDIDPAGPTLTLSQTSVPEGSATVTATGAGFPATSTLTAHLRQGTAALGTVTTDSTGAFSLDIDLTGRPRGGYAISVDGDGVAAGRGLSVVRQPVNPGDIGEPVSYVNTLIGTGNGGPEAGEINNFPGPSVPFGMAQYSPDTVNGYAGYVISDDRLKGFSMTHASVGCSAFGDIPALPTTQSADAAPWDQIEQIAHNDTERGIPGYYTVQMPASGISAELTASTRTGIGRFDYPAGKPALLQIKASGSKGGNRDASISIGEDGVVTGSSTSGGFCGKQNTYTVYFAMRFDSPVTGYGTWDRNSGSVDAGNRSATGSGVGGWVSFDQGQEVTVTTAISYVSADGARANLAEADGKSFEQIAEAGSEAWNDMLSAISVTGTDQDDLEMFYTSLFHSFQHPNTFNDIDGRYLGFDGTVHTVEAGRDQYSNFSDWDTYRSLVPLVSMLFPDRASDMAQSLVNAAVQSGSLPRWSIANSPTGQMTGDSVSALLSNTYAFGATDFDAETALSYMVKAAREGGQSTTYPWYTQRPGAQTYSQLGYAPQTPEFKGDHQIVGASITLEWSVDDFAIGKLAAALGHTDLAGEFQHRAQNWQNLLDPSSRYILPRDRFGAFLAAPDFTNPPGGIGWPGFDEGNAAQYLWMVPQNVDALVAGLGGRETVSDRLDDFFVDLNTGSKRPYLWAGNEPNFGVPWMYNYIGEPWKTQATVDRVRAQLFSPIPNGMPGNDDLGAQSSWFVWAAIGLYPATAGTSILTVNTPLFDEVSVTLPGGNTITVSAPGASGKADTQYIQSMTVNGTGYDGTSLPADTVFAGADIDYQVASTPNTAWGADVQDAPPSFTEGGKSAVFAPQATLTVAPGQSAPLNLYAQRLLSTAETVSVTASAPEGITAGDAQIALGPDGAGATTTIVTVGPDVPEGYTTVTFTATVDGVPSLAAATLIVARANSLVAAYNVIATAPQGDNGTGRFDSDGGSFQREQLAAAGLAPGQQKAVSGTTFTWPLSPVGRPDSVEPHGQRIDFDAPASRVTFIGASRNGGQEGTGTAWFDDGTSAPLTIGLDDWVGMSGPGGTPGYGGSIVAAMSDRNTPYGGGNAQIYATAPFDAPVGRTIVAVTLPDAERQRIFAIGTAEPVSTTTTLTSSNEEPAAGDPVTLTATVAPADAAGSVTFTGLPGGDVVAAVVDGVASVDIVPDTRGPQQYTGWFEPSVAGVGSSTSDPVIVQVAAPTLTLSATEATAGSVVTIDAVGFLPGEDVQATLADTSITAATDEDGALRFEVALPTDALPGAVQLSVIGLESGLSAVAQINVIEAVPGGGEAPGGGGGGMPTVTVPTGVGAAAEAGSSQLSSTGADVTGVALFAALLFGVGSAIIIFRRKRGAARR